MVRRTTLTRKVDPVLAADMREFSRRQAFPHVEVRRMSGSRYQEIVLSWCSLELGSCTIGYTRGKESSRMYVLPKLDQGQHVPPVFHFATPTTHFPAGEPHAR